MTNNLDQGISDTKNGNLTWSAGQKLRTTCYRIVKKPPANQPKQNTNEWPFNLNQEENQLKQNAEVWNKRWRDVWFRSAWRYKRPISTQQSTAENNEPTRSKLVWETDTQNKLRTRSGYQAELKVSCSKHQENL